MRSPSPPSFIERLLSGESTASLALVAVVALGVGVSFGLDWRQSEINMQSVARERGAALFRLVELTRQWNAIHGGVYVPLKPGLEPNPYLDHPRRDLKTVDGMALTMINPAYMTRQIAEIAERGEGFRLHITSLKPIRPGNAPDPWEAQALRSFEAGKKEVLEGIPGDVPVHRYMAPLRVIDACMPCHRAQGYKVGDVRGGISVTMPAAELLAIRDQERWRSLGGHLLVFAIVAGLLHLLVLRARRHVQALRALNAEQEQVIAARTHSLIEANAELEHEVSERKVAAAVFESAADAILVTDDEGRIVQVNPAFLRMTGYPESEAVGQPVSFLKSGRHTREFFDTLWRTLEKENRWQGEVWNRRRNGEVFLAWLSITRVAGRAAPVRYVASMSDVTWRKEMEDALRHRAYHDPLTNLPNRALFTDRLLVAIRQGERHGHTFALCFIDLDRFKEVNDKLGHAAGDDLLVEVAKRLQAAVRASDTVARLGGDEFAAILTEVDSMKEVEDVADRCVATLAQPFLLQAGTVIISGSVGVALYPEHGRDAEALQHSADAALYRVKDSSRNGWHIHAGKSGESDTPN